MVWTAPMTAVDGNIFKASEFNTHIRDNLMETGPALNLASGGFFSVTGLNSISASFPQNEFITSGSDQTTTSTSYTDLATVGPTISNITVGGFVFISLGAKIFNSTSGNMTRMSVELTADPLSGGVGQSASDAWSVGQSRGVPYQLGGSFVIIVASPGTYTFTAKYKVAGGTGNFNNRSLFVFPF